MQGILLVDKPSGWTSFDVVNKVRRLIEGAGLNHTGRKRFPVGHTGTLDPLATGLLVLALGEHTRRVQELTKLDKTYDVVMRLGQTSTTGDAEGELQDISQVVPSDEAVRTALQRFSGHLMQTPPRFSAMKINGQRAYKLAREGKEVHLEPRPVTVYANEYSDYSYPDVRFISEVSSGTYIRSLVEDIGTELGTGAYMAGLRRTKVGDFDIKEAVAMQEMSPELIAANVFPLG